MLQSTTLDPVAFLSTEYLQRYVASGGAAVKVLSADPQRRERFVLGMANHASALGFTVATVDAATSKGHLINEMFFAIARQINWLDAARAQLHVIVERAGFTIPPNADYSLKELATANDVDLRQINQALRWEMRRTVLQSAEYTRLFKHVILALVSGTLDATGPAGFLANQVVSWLCGDRVEMKTLKQAYISRRINRQNARALIIDLGRWLQNVGKRGLVVTADMSLYSNGLPRADFKRYTPSNALDLFELIRQFIDQSDLCKGLFFLFSFGPEFLEDRRRGMNAYLALKMRLADDVYDTSHPNLMAPLLRLSEC